VTSALLEPGLRAFCQVGILKSSGHFFDSAVTALQ